MDGSRDAFLQNFGTAFGNIAKPFVKNFHLIFLEP
jgi:hypothetical protein